MRYCKANLAGPRISNRPLGCTIMNEVTYDADRNCR
jgi:hypothetical protein